MIQAGHGGAVDHLHLSADGRMAASASAAEGTVRIWQVPAGKLVATFQAPDNTVRSLRFAPGGHAALLAASGRHLVLWDARSRRVLGRHDAQSEVLAARFSPDGRFIAYANAERSLVVLDVGTLSVKARLENPGWPRHPSVHLAFSPDGGRIAWTAPSAASAVELVDWRSGRSLATLPIDGPLADLEFLPDGLQLMTHVRVPRPGEGSRIQVWNLAGRQARAVPLAPGTWVGTAQPLGNGRLGYSSGDQLTVVDLATGAAMHRHEFGEAFPLARSALFAGPNGDVLLVGGRDGTLGAWSLAAGRYQEWTPTGSSVADAVHTGPSLLTLGAHAGPALLWDLTSAAPRPLRTADDFFSSGTVAADAMALTTDRTVVALATRAYPDPIRLFDIRTGRQLIALGERLHATSARLALSGDGAWLALRSGLRDTVELFDLRAGGPPRTLRVGTTSTGPEHLFLNPDGSRLVVAGLREIRAFDTRRLELLWQRSSEEIGSHATLQAAALSADGTRLVLATASSVVLLDAVHGARLAATEAGWRPASWPGCIVFAPGGAAVYFGDLAGEIWSWDLNAAKPTRVAASSGSGPVKSLSFSPDGRHLVVAEQVSVVLRDARSGAWLARLAQWDDGNWLAVDPEGRFDAARLEGMTRAHWVSPDDPGQALPLESFMREYYEPRLLAKALAGGPRPRPRPLAGLERVLPRVRVASVRQDSRRPWMLEVDIDVERGAAGSRHQVRDLRLLRGGRLVASERGPLALDAHGKARRSFRVATTGGEKPEPVLLEAYAFNADGVKSVTHALRHVPEQPARKLSRTAYLLHVGVNRHENPAWDLAFAANDARRLGDVLEQHLGDGTQFDRVVRVDLVSAGDSAQGLPTKANIGAVLRRLSGPTADAGALAQIPGAQHLRTAGPADLVLLSFSGHGFATADGEFHLVPLDTGPGTTREVTESLRTHSISTAELSDWLGNVDAGELVLIVDACHSAAAIQGTADFRPGPMGSRGLGQLAYDKGMRVLAASQAADFALESRALRHGLLSYVLINDGLERRMANHRPVDRQIELEEWLSFAVERVPLVYQELAGGGKLRGAALVGRTGPGQRPALFDFTRGSPGPALLEWVD